MQKTSTTTLNAFLYTPYSESASRERTHLTPFSADTSHENYSEVPALQNTPDSCKLMQIANSMALHITYFAASHHPPIHHLILKIIFCQSKLSLKIIHLCLWKPIYIKCNFSSCILNREQSYFTFIIKEKNMKKTGKS